MADLKVAMEDMAEIIHEEAAVSSRSFAALLIADSSKQARQGTIDVALKGANLDLQYLNDKERNKRLTRRADWRIVPLLSFMYLLNYLDRGNVGNAKVLNEETGDSLLQQTNMTTGGYAIAMSLFSVSYTLFEVPSNWIMKRYVRPSLWLAALLFCWGALTLGFAGVKTYAQVIVIRFLIGLFEAGFFPGKLS